MHGNCGRCKHITFRGHMRVQCWAACIISAGRWDPFLQTVSTPGPAGRQHGSPQVNCMLPVAQASAKPSSR